MIARNTISFFVMLSTSPTRRLEYLLKLPPLERIASPIATEQDENTEMIVSADAIFALPIWFNSSAKIIAKMTIERFVSATPHTTPTAIPVSAECPNASEKYAIFLLTIIVPISPKSGVMMRIAISAFLIKPKSSQDNQLIIFVILLDPFFFVCHRKDALKFRTREHFLCGSLL